MQVASGDASAPLEPVHEAHDAAEHDKHDENDYGTGLMLIGEAIAGALRPKTTVLLLRTYRCTLQLSRETKAQREATAHLHLRAVEKFFTSERKIDHIAKKLEEFGHALENLESRPQAASSSAYSSRGPASTTPSSLKLTLETHTSPSSPASRAESMILTPRLEYEGESSLSAQAAFANRFLLDAVVSKPSVDITGEMASVLESLSRTMGKQSDQQEADYLYPHARALEPGFNLRNLPMPPVDSAFTCLRMAKEHPRVRFFWNHEANSVSSFTEYFLKVYSPGSATHSDLIIVNAGLYWLFLECKSATEDPNKKADFEAQAVVCRDNLETILSNLPFHQPSTMDATCAMALAGMYCLHTCKPSAAWTFIATASRMSQTLGMHSVVAMAHEDPQIRIFKIKLFWLIYVQDKGLSLRLGRSSTIRDNDVTVSPITFDSRSEMGMLGQLHKMTELARMQGMIYDQIYSPAALIQPQAIRTARARRLASELEALITNISADERRYLEVMRQAVGDKSFEAIISIAKVSHLSLFCLIYRAIPAEPNEGTVFGKECISSARQALEAHQRCMAVVVDLGEDFVETYVNWALLQSPFVPFIVLFCHIIETCNESDLGLLGSLIETLQSASTDSFSTGIKKETRLFKALYDVACSYLKLKSSSTNTGIHPWASAASLLQPTAAQAVPAVLTPASTDPQGVAQTPLPDLVDSGIRMGTTSSQSVGWVPGSFGTSEDFGMEVDQQSTQLGNWLYMNNQMIRALEDSYFWGGSE
ncbi:putative transcriptional regulatory protein C11D3.07c 3 [Colletotrichum chlorophyti]|uniref:Putative transcriptional regulatory protein C11D3.07c 3 n=1 Tax=Colletotrichum chlorophyti TaxID=708187 RepID=A0A1Q8RZT4_9PEZI|nr:putative transcriptional regulatory protein C11D3.07c 3 [Colletotrichum chlorophyti]